MVIHNYYGDKINKLFEILNENNLLIPFNEDPIIDKIFERNNSTMHVSEMKHLIITDDELFDKYKKFWLPFDVNEFDLYNDFIQQGATYILSLFELMNRFFHMILDLKKLNLKENATLGSISHSISKICNFDKKELDETLMIGIRNMIAHDSWYLEEKNFCYKENQTIKKLDLKEFVQLIVNVTDLSSTIALKWAPYMVNLEFERSKDMRKEKSKRK